MMSSENAVELDNITKQYRLMESPLSQLLNVFNIDSKRLVKRKIVLNGVSFKIRKRENVGILGINGAGKSTLLSMIAGLTKPTDGAIYINGTIGSILELGAGFHHELTGRQNSETLLMLQGVPHYETREKLKEIEEFAELGDAFDTKTRTYSSGMLVRLAFATAAVMKPDIFLVDEALAVGDARFQQKCYDYLLKKMSGSTLILISHDMSAISSICDRVIILDKGKVIYDGSPKDGIAVYNRISLGKPGAASAINHDRRIGPRHLDILEAQVTVNGASSAVSLPGDMIEISTTIMSKTPADHALLSFSWLDARGSKVFGQSLPSFKINQGEEKRVTCRFQWPNLLSGSYFLSLNLGQGERETLKSLECLLDSAWELEAVQTEPPLGFFNVGLF